jgi:hypothetical protein
MHGATHLEKFMRDSQANWEMMESLLSIEDMVGATTPELVILVSNLPQKENCKLPGLVQNLLIFGCQQMAKRLQTTATQIVQDGQL